MNIISSFVLSLENAVFCLRMFLGAVLLRHEYESQPSLQEFNVLDGEDFIDVSVDFRS